MFGGDILDLLHEHSQETMTGTYYVTTASNPSTVGIKFDYEQIDPDSWQYRNLFANVIQTNGKICAIKTCDPIDFKVGSFISTLDGEFWVIDSVSKDFSSVPEQAYRFSAEVAGIEKVIRLISQANPWGVR